MNPNNPASRQIFLAHHDHRIKRHHEEHPYDGLPRKEAPTSPKHIKIAVQLCKIQTACEMCCMVLLGYYPKYIRIFKQ
jgi:hypothetical protein